MLGFVVRTGFRMLALAGLLYVTFFIPLGPRTLYGHMTRIASTAEAHEFGTAIYASAKDAAKACVSKFETWKPKLAR